MTDDQKFAKLIETSIQRTWTGTAGELLVLLWDRGISYLPEWYHSPRGISPAVDRAMPHLPGWSLSRRKTGGRRLISLAPPRRAG